MAKPKAKVAGEGIKAVRKINDVSRASDVASSPNSKSIIVSNRPLMRDPMMAATAVDAEDTYKPAASSQSAAAPTAAPATVHHERVILPHSSAPVSAGSDTKPATEPAVTPPSARPSIAEKAPLAAPAAVASPELPVADTTSTDSPDSAEDEGDEGPVNPEAAEVTADEAAAERRKVLDELVEAQTYFLPVNASGQKRAKQTMLLGILLILVLAAAWLDIALDAKLISIPGVEAPTNFFSN